MAENTVQAQARFSGRVQGVGFRYTTVQIASGYDVRGYVMNRPDGTVEVVAEGERDAVQGFLDAVSRRMSWYVEDCETAWRPATGAFHSFSVRFA